MFQFFHKNADYLLLISEKIFRIFINFSIFLLMLTYLNDFEYTNFITTFTIYQLIGLVSSVGIDTKYNYRCAKNQTYLRFIDEFVIARSYIASVYSIIVCVTINLVYDASGIEYLTIMLFCLGGLAPALETNLLIDGKIQTLAKITIPSVILFFFFKIYLILNEHFNYILFAIALESVTISIGLYISTRKFTLLYFSKNSLNLRRFLKLFISRNNFLIFTSELIVVFLQRVFILSSAFIYPNEMIKISAVIQRSIDFVMLISANYNKLVIKRFYSKLKYDYKILTFILCMIYVALVVILSCASNLDITLSDWIYVCFSIINMIFFILYQRLRFLLNRNDQYFIFAKLSTILLSVYLINILSLSQLNLPYANIALLPIIIITIMGFKYEKYV